MAESKYMTKDQLSEVVGLNKQRIDTFLCRSEFNHIRRGWLGRKRVFMGITQKDIEKLQSLKKCNRRLKDGYIGVM